MSGTARILWVDDAIATGGGTTQTLTLMQKTDGIHATGCHPNAIDKYLERTFDLFLVDYRLNKEPDADQEKYEHTGISVAGLIRDNFPDLPIYLTSALIDDEASHKVESELFDRVISHKTLTRLDGIIGVRDDALDYRRIRNAKGRTSIKSIHSLLRTLNSANSEVERVLPESFRHGLGARQHERTPALPTTVSSGTIRFGKWVTQLFLAHPGVLYDELYAATYLGMTSRHFLGPFAKTVLEYLYDGVFSKTHDARWWKSGLTDLVVANPKAKTHGALRFIELAPKVLNIPKAARSRCLVCKNPFPETVAYDRDNHDRRGPAHLSCSEPDPDRKPILYYEPYRRFVE